METLNQIETKQPLMTDHENAMPVKEYKGEVKKMMII